MSSLTFVTLLLAIISGLCLYEAKHRAEVLDGQIARTLGQVAAARERVGPLRAEWALLDEPRRLDALARRHLGLRPLAASQYMTFPDLGSRLPPRPEPGASSWPISAHVEGPGRIRDSHAVHRTHLPSMSWPARPRNAGVTAAEHLQARGPVNLATRRLAGGMWAE